MKDNQLIVNLFKGKEIRSVWSDEKEDYYFSVIDVIFALTESENARRYWSDLKRKLIDEGSQLYDNIVQLKLKAPDNKLRMTDVLDTKGIFRLIESVPSPNAEPFKMWLANLGKLEVDNMFDPSKGIDKMLDYYLAKGYSLEWIEERIKAIISRKKLTLVWKENGVNNNQYAILTNEIYKTWSGMTAKEYKHFKGLRKENLRDNMSDIEVALTTIGEITTRDIAKNEKPKGMKENIKVAKRGGSVAKNTLEDYEKQTGNKAILSNSHRLIDYDKKA